jgi:O-antigen/teichoic acid export membrane protein
MTLGRATPYFAAKAIPGLLLLVAIPIWVRHFGHIAYGEYSIALSVATVLAPLSIGWLQQSLLRGTGNPRWSAGALLRSRRRALTLLALVSLAFTASLSLVIRLSDGALMASGIAGITVTMAAYLPVLTQLQRSGHARAFAFAEICRPAITLGSSLLIAQLLGGEAHGANALIAATMMGYALSGFGAISLAGRREWGRLGSESIGPADVRGMWSYGWPLSMWLALSSMLVTVDRVLLGLFTSLAVVGNYAAVADLVWRGTSAVGYPVTMTLQPSVMQLWNSGEFDEARTLVRRWSIRLAVVLMSVSVGSYLLSDRFLAIALRGVSLPPVAVLLLALGASAWQLALLLHKELEFQQQTRLMLYFLLTAVAATTLADLVLIPSLGATGAAVGAAAGAGTYCLLSMRMAHRLRSAESSSVVRI